MSDKAPSSHLPTLVGDHLALDFLNSIAAPSGTPIEWISSGRGLVTWMVGAKAITPADAKSIHSQFSTHDLDQAAREAIALREWFRDVLKGVKTQEVRVLPSADINHLNNILARDASHLRIENVKDTQLSLSAQRIWHKSSDLLVPLATSMAELLCKADLSLIQNCSNPPCTMWFYDRTKGHRRRWCSQAVCGNRAKVAAFRERQKRKV